MPAKDPKGKGGAKRKAQDATPAAAASKSAAAKKAKTTPAAAPSKAAPAAKKAKASAAAAAPAAVPSLPLSKASSKKWVRHASHPLCFSPRTNNLHSHTCSQTHTHTHTLHGLLQLRCCTLTQTLTVSGPPSLLIMNQGGWPQEAKAWASRCGSARHVQ